MKMTANVAATKYSRRAILKSLGLGAGFLPLLSTERARAANASGFPTRFISITWTDGVCPPNFYLSGGAGPLPATLPSILQPLAAWSSKLILFRNASKQQSPFDLQTMIDGGATYGGHWSYPSLLTGDVTVSGSTSTANAPSIDQLIANNLATQGVNNALLNVGCRPYSTYTSWRSAGTPNVPQTDPYKLFSSLFSGPSMPTTQVNALLARRKSVLDYVGTQLTKFSNNLGSDDKVKVQSHLDSIRSIENQLTTSTSPTPATCVAPSITPTGLNFNTVTNYPDHVRFMADIVAAAVICGKARSVTMDLIDNGGGNSLTFPWLNIPSPDFHAIAHQGSDNYAQKAVIDQWFYQQCVAELVGKLAAVSEGTGTVLDNTVILVCNDMNEGANHWVGGIPYVLIGSAGGFFKTGRQVTFSSQMPNNKLLTSILHACGVASTGLGKYAGDIDSSLTM
jgi:hypothetical protein